MERLDDVPLGTQGPHYASIPPPNGKKVEIVRACAQRQNLANALQLIYRDIAQFCSATGSST